MRWPHFVDLGLLRTLPNQKTERRVRVRVRASIKVGVRVRVQVQKYIPNGIIAEILPTTSVQIDQILLCIR